MPPSSCSTWWAPGTNSTQTSPYTSQHIHGCVQAYNAAFKQFNVVCPGDEGALVWSEEFYDMLQNTVGGGKPKMR